MVAKNANFVMGWTRLRPVENCVYIVNQMMNTVTRCTHDDVIDGQ